MAKLGENYLRRSTRRPVLTYTSAEEWPSPPQSFEPESETLRRLQYLLQLGCQEVPKSYAVLLEWHYQLGLPIKDIAVKLGKNEGAIKIALHRARIKLRKVLKPYEDELKDLLY
jgi:DNA-directed RNA polymerase specialized sigma24 family protein